MSAPGIQWWKYQLDSTGTSVSSGKITNNTVDYDAVQAGSYSNVMCVRPQFSSTSQIQPIGKLRFWWYGIGGSINGTSHTSLPNQGWVMKYYVTDCSTECSSASDPADSSITVETRMQNVAYMLNSFANATIKTQATKGKTFNDSTSNRVTFGDKQAYYKSTWQQPTTQNLYVAMQPIPFFQSGFCNAAQQNQTFQNNTHYNTSTWMDIVFQGGGVTNNNGEALNYSVGGVLNSQYSCNLVASVSNQQDFPFIFLTVKPPSNAEAGTWSSFSCRLSFIWPYSTSTTV